jgi:hypothetical protein
MNGQPPSGGHEIEERLHMARRRYAAARDQLARVREEYEILGMACGIDPELLNRAAIRVAAINATCLRVRREIDEIERLLESRISTLRLRAALVR